MSSNYPNGFLDTLIVKGMPITQLHPGNIYWVNNSGVLPDKGIGGSDGNKGSYLQPFSTLDYAVGKCKASRGDIIALMPGHAESYDTAGVDLTLDVAGIAIVGLGTGSLRPTITQGTDVLQTIAVSAANITIYNVYFKADFQDITIGFTLTTAKYFSLINCQFDDVSSSKCWVHIVNATGSANTVDGLYVQDCVYNGLDATFATFAKVDAAQDDIRFIGNVFWSINAGSSIPVALNVVGVPTHLYMARNITHSAGTTNLNILVKSTGTTGTGFITDNVAHSLDQTGVHCTIAGGYSMSLLHHAGTIDVQSKIQDPAEET